MQTAQRNKIIPTVGSRIAGPLGAIHLPRLWAKLLLSSRGLLPDDYDPCGDGFDAMTIQALGLDREELMSFVRTEQPKYMALEIWVLHNTRETLDAKKIEAHNRAILSYRHDDATAKTMRASSGVTDPSISDAARLNALDDFDQLHAQITSPSR